MVVFLKFLNQNSSNLVDELPKNMASSATHRQGRCAGANVEWIVLISAHEEAKAQRCQSKPGHCFEITHFHQISKKSTCYIKF